MDLATSLPAYLKWSKWSGMIFEYWLGWVVIPFEEGQKKPLEGSRRSLNTLV